MKNKAISFFIFALLAFSIFPTFNALLKPGYFPMHDDMQAMRLLQMDKCVRDGQIPCRWVPDMGYGYGYPQFNYYNPLPYYIMEAFHLLGLGYLDSVKAGFVASVVLSGLGMYLLGRELWGRAGGIISALFYIYAPYRAVDMYVRGAVGEFYALAFLPFIFWSAKRVVGGDKKALLWLALSLAGLFTSHNVSSLITAPFLVAWVAYLLFKKHGFTSPLFILKENVYLIYSFLWSLLMAAFFILPALAEQKYVHIETLTVGYFNYLAHFVSIKQMLFSSYWGYGSSELGPYDDVSLSVGILHWTIPVFLVITALLKRKKTELKYLLFFVLAGFLAIFFMHQRSTFIWERLSILSLVQFPWRFLILATFAFSVAAGAFPRMISDRRWKIILGVGLGVLLIMFNISFFRPVNWLNLTDSDKFSGDLWEKQLTISIFDYLPKSADFPPAEKAFELPRLANGSEINVNGEKGTDWQQWTIVLEERGIVVFPIYNFPNWEVRANETVMPVEPYGELGLVSAELPEGETSVFIDLKDTFVRKFANLLTFLGFLLIPMFIYKLKQK